MAKKPEIAEQGLQSADRLVAVPASLYDLARSRGIPDRVAQKVVMYEPPQGGRGERFKTKKDFERDNDWTRTELLRWLLDLLQDGYEVALSRRKGWDFELFLWGYAPQRPPTGSSKGTKWVDIALPTFADIENLRQDFAPAAIWLLRESRDLDIRDWQMSLGGEKEVRLQLGRIAGKPFVHRFWYEWRTAFLMHAIDLIESHGARVRTCSASGCERLFVPNKRQAFCSRSCGLKERQRRFREQYSEEEWAERRHAFYAKGLAKAKGPSILNKVRRRKGVPSNSSRKES